MRLRFQNVAKLKLSQWVVGNTVFFFFLLFFLFSSLTIHKLILCCHPGHPLNSRLIKLFLVRQDNKVHVKININC